MILFSAAGMVIVIFAKALLTERQSSILVKIEGPSTFPIQELETQFGEEFAQKLRSQGISVSTPLSAKAIADNVENEESIKRSIRLSNQMTFVLAGRIEPDETNQNYTLILETQLHRTPTKPINHDSTRLTIDSENSRELWTSEPIAFKGIQASEFKRFAQFHINQSVDLFSLTAKRLATGGTRE